MSVIVFISLFEKLSIITTLLPAFINSHTVCDPIKPIPPVTNTVFIFILYIDFLYLFNV